MATLPGVPQSGVSGSQGCHPRGHGIALFHSSLALNTSTGDQETGGLVRKNIRKRRTCVADFASRIKVIWRIRDLGDGDCLLANRAVLLHVALANNLYKPPVGQIK